eukprot:6212411-Pleurochrysis_carterae.AAC.2
MAWSLPQPSPSLEDGPSSALFDFYIKDSHIERTRALLYRATCAQCRARELSESARQRHVPIPYIRDAPDRRRFARARALFPPCCVAAQRQAEGQGRRGGRGDSRAMRPL